MQFLLVLQSTAVTLSLMPYDSLALWFSNGFLLLTLFWAGYFFDMEVVMSIVGYLVSVASTHNLSVIILPTPPWQLQCFQIFQNIPWGANWPPWKPLFQRNVYHSPKYFPLFSCLIVCHYYVLFSSFSPLFPISLPLSSSSSCYLTMLFNKKSFTYRIFTKYGLKLRVRVSGWAQKTWRVSNVTVRDWKIYPI